MLRRRWRRPRLSRVFLLAMAAGAFPIEVPIAPVDLAVDDATRRPGAVADGRGQGAQQALEGEVLRAAVQVAEVGVLARVDVPDVVAHGGRGWEEAERAVVVDDWGWTMRGRGCWK